MNPRFKPLISQSTETGATQRPFNLKVVSAESPTATFRPLSSILPAGKVGSAAGGAAPDPEDVVDPKLELRRQGDKITRISVTCNCGRLHEIECEY